MHKSQGFTFIELLVSLVILAVGLTSLALLQSKASFYHSSSHSRSIAVAQIGDISDRMRANRAGVNAGNYNNITGTPASASSCTQCTPAQIAVSDHFEWNTENTNVLPGGQGTVTRVNDSFRVTLMWDNERTGVTGTACSGNSAVDLTCISMLIEF